MTWKIQVREALEKSPTAFGFWQTIPSGASAKNVLRAVSASPTSHSISWVLIDAEHGRIAEHNYYELTVAISSEGASPIIRVPGSEEWMVKRALDSGAHGILVPMCNSADDAQRVARYAKYPPLGVRGYGPTFAMHCFPTGFSYDDEADRALMILVQVESRAGVDNVESIAATDIDGIIIGPFDLAKQLCVVHGGEEHEAAIQRILKAAKAHGKHAGIFCISGEQARTRAEQGFDMVSIITDLSAMEDGMIRGLRTACGENLGECPAKSLKY